MLRKNVIAVAILVLFIGLAHADKLADIKKLGVLKAGTKVDFKPFGFTNEKNKVVGFDIDLINYIAKELGVKVKFVPVSGNQRVTLLMGGQIDIASASLTHTIKRDDTIDFTISYFFDGQSILAKKDCKVKEAKDFANKKIGVVQGTTSGENFKKLVPKAKIVSFQGYPQAVMALKKGKIDAVSSDLVWCMAQAKKSHGAFKVVGDTISFEPYGMGIAENESNLRDAVNFAIQKAVKDGTYTKLYNKWFGKDPERLPELWP